MPKLSDIQIDAKRFKGKGIRPWNDENVIKPANPSVSKPLADREQTVSKPLADREQVKSEKTGSVSKPLAEALAIPLADREQTVSKPLANYDKSAESNDIEILVGKERDLLDFLFQKCQLTGSLVSPTITTDELKNYLKINAMHLRNLIYRLVKKEVIKVVEIKNGQASWRRFKFSKETYQSLSLNRTVSKPLADREQTVSKPLAEALAEPLASLSSSSSSNIYNNKTTTTSDTEKSHLSKLNDEWLKINIEPLSGIGFTETHLEQIASQNLLSPDIVQNSIYAFAFDLDNNDKAKTLKKDPINFFMGILRRGMPYAPPDNYEHPKDKATRLYLESMRKVVQKREKIRQEMMNVAFEDWYYKLENGDAKSFLPIEMKLPPSYANAPKESRIVKDKARAHFIENIWSTLQKTIEENVLPEEL